MNRKQKSGKRKKIPVCPQCRARQVIPVVHGPLTPATIKALRQGRATRGSSEEWEGISEWHCKSCGCEWRGRWLKFKR